MIEVPLAIADSAAKPCCPSLENVSGARECLFASIVAGRLDGRTLDPWWGPLVGSRRVKTLLDQRLP